MWPTSMREWMKPLVPPLMVLAAVGLVLCVASHLAALCGLPAPLGDYSWLLGAGLFAVWLPMIIVARPLTEDCKSKDFWKAALRGCPPWMKYMLYGLMGYALISFFFTANSDPARTPSATGRAVPPGLFGFLTAFYSVAFALFYSALHVSDRDAARRCLNGHAVGPLAQFCEQCGQPVVDQFPGPGLPGQ